jgi:hypothetical protein
MSTPIFYVHIRTRGVTAQIRLNDAAIYEVAAEHAQIALPTISEWVIVGENTLSVRVTELGVNPRLHVALCQAAIGDVPELGREHELIRIDWPPLPVEPAVDLEVEAEVPVEPEPPALPLELREVGVAGHPWGEWSWQRAPTFNGDRRTITEVVAYLRDLHAALAAGQIDILIQQSAIKFNEVAPIYDMSVADAQQRIHGAWAELSSLPGWQLAPFDEADVDLRLHCDGRLVEPTTLAGEPILRQARAIDGERWSLPIFVARTHWEYVAGQLVVVR